MHNLIRNVCFFVFVCTLSWMTCIISSAIAQDELPSPSFQQQSHDHITEVHFTEHSTSALQGKWLFYPSQFIVQPSPVLQSKTVELPASFKTLATVPLLVILKFRKNFSGDASQFGFRPNTVPIGYMSMDSLLSGSGKSVLHLKNR